MKKYLFFLLLLFQTHFAFGNFVCDDNIYGYIALYTPNEYTCNSGYYLPAGGVQCIMCPNGFTCPGGTFVFNQYIFQGLSFENIPNNTMNNVCADNFPTKLLAHFEPNEIAITWQDNDGTTITTNTCTYVQPITLPANPTRKGYAFTGWRVVNN